MVTVPFSLRLKHIALATACITGGIAASASAAPLITNGNFAQNNTLATEAAESASYNSQHNTGELSGVVGTNAQASSVTGWSFGTAANTFDFVIDLNTYGTVYSPTPPGTNGTVAYWDNGDNHFSGFNANPGADPNGSAFAIASDPSHLNAAITQAVSGLTVGDRYQLTFEQASAQQYGYGGNFTAAWQVSLGGLTQTAATMTNPSGQASSWTTQTLNFIATSSTETLTFLSTASLGASPPFLLLDDVALADIPEPGTVASSLIGLACVMAAAAFRRRRLRG